MMQSPFFQTFFSVVILFPCLPVADYNPESSENPLPFTNDPNELDGFGSTVAGTATTVMGSSQPVVQSGTPDNLIPVYCSILAAVIVGLVAYIAFKR